MTTFFETKYALNNKIDTGIKINNKGFSSRKDIILVDNLNEVIGNIWENPEFLIIEGIEN